MRLADLLPESEGRVLANAAGQIELKGLTADSREVSDGYLFAAIPGTHLDGRRFIDEAIARGAVAVLAPAGTTLQRQDRGVTLIGDDNPRRRLALMAAAFYGRQPRRIVAVTGTSGKTSVTSFLRQIWSSLGIRAASLGTLGLMPPLAEAPGALTTPDPVALMRCLAQLAEAGVDHLAIEASSHGLEQCRLDGLRISVAAFTNLSRDHLDYHDGMASYLAAKTRLFAELLPRTGTAVLNADTPEADALARTCRARGQRVVTFGEAGSDLRLAALRPGPRGLDLEIEAGGRRHAVSLSLVGTFQAANVLAAAALALSEDLALEDVIAVLPSLTGVPGRLEPVGTSPGGGQVFVDYAHKPGALEAVLEAVRSHTSGRLLVVFGCGGDRDQGKRPQMGAIAGRLAERVIVTDDNPRSEDPAAIRAQILASVPEASEIGDRAEAIRQAVAELGPGDTLVIAGKGHETGQTVGGRVLPFDDRVVARAAIAEVSGAAG